VEREAEALVTWRAAVSLALLTAFGSVLGYLYFPSAGPPLLFLRVASFLWAMGLLLVLFAQRRAPRLSILHLVFALTPIPLFPTFWFVGLERTAQALPFELFVRQNLSAVLYALATPPSAAISLLVIVAFTAEALLLTDFSHRPGDIGAYGWQPWTSLLYGLCAMVIALYRAQRQRREVAMIIEIERSISLRRIFRAYLTVRDFVNTPLQTLTISLSLLEGRCPEASDIRSRMERSVARLEELNHILQSEASVPKWTSGHDSFDPLSSLRTTDASGRRTIPEDQRSS
jgi:hypothetical protein